MMSTLYVETCMRLCAPVTVRNLKATLFTMATLVIVVAMINLVKV
jgi:hypothetical protein